MDASIPSFQPAAHRIQIYRCEMRDGRHQSRYACGVWGALNMPFFGQTSGVGYGVTVLSGEVGKSAALASGVGQVSER